MRSVLAWLGPPNALILHERFGAERMSEEDEELEEDDEAEDEERWGDEETEE